MRILTRNDPFAQTAAVPRVTLLIQIPHQLRDNIPVAPEIEVLYRVHGQVLDNGELNLGREQVQVDEVPVKLLARIVHLGIINEVVEALSRVYPRVEQLEHVRALAMQCDGKARCSIVEAHPRRLYELAKEMTR